MGRHLLLLLAFALAGTLAVSPGCRPRVKVKPRIKTNWVKTQPRTRMPTRKTGVGNRTRSRHRAVNGEERAGVPARNRSLLGRIGDAQADALVEGLLKQALGLEDMRERYARMNREEQAAIWRRVQAQPARRGRGFEDLRRVVRRR